MDVINYTDSFIDSVNAMTITMNVCTDKRSSGFMNLWYDMIDAIEDDTSEVE